ncbi:hypothetical protein [Burkholderia multivorans]
MKEKSADDQNVTYNPRIILSEAARQTFDSLKTKSKCYDRVSRFLDRLNGQSGTMILMSGLSTKRAIDPADLRASIGRRLTVALLRADFQVKINDQEISASEALPTFEYHIGRPESLNEETVIVGGRSRPVKFWVGFVKEAKWPADQAGIGVYAHGKIAQDRPFTFGNRGKEIYTRYMYGVVEADWIDELNDDVVSTDRTSIDWSAPETTPLYEWGQRKVSAWVSEFERWKRQQDGEESRNTIDKVTRERKLQLSAKETEVVAAMLSEMNQFLGKDENAKLKAAESLAGAWIHLPMREMTKRLWDIFKPGAINAPDFLKVLDELHANLVPEALSLSVTFAQRIYALTVLENRVHLGTETDLQKLIERFTWILDPTFERLTANQELKTVVEQADRQGFVTPSIQGRVVGIDNLRPDFVFFSPPGEENFFRVVELKNPQIPLAPENVEQLRGYLNYLEGKFSGCDVEGILIGKDPHAVRPHDPRITVQDWGTILRNSRKGHADLVAAMLAGTDAHGSDARVGQVVKYGGQATVDMLTRLSEKDESLRRLMQEVQLNDPMSSHGAAA